jgi:hypothetical protein
MDDLIQSTVGEVKKLLADPKNKNAAIASAIAYYVSNDNKERNAVIAGILAYTLLPTEEEEDGKR